MKQRVHEKALKEFDRLLTIMDELRVQCPWDREQTFESLRKLTLEESYELAEAIIQENKDGIRGELGDLLLHVVFYAKIASEDRYFSMEDVIHGICEKLIHRHPHIYGEVKVNSADDVERNWENLKLKEGRKGVLEGVPASLPALIKANRIQEKVHGIGFDWKDKSQIWDKINEELLELNAEIKKAPQKKDTTLSYKVEEEFGDLLFTIVNAARLYGIEPENALERTNLKFMKRFNYIEDTAGKMNKPLQSMSLDTMNNLWEEAKKMEK